MLSPQITLAQAGNANLLAYLNLIAWAEGTSTSPITQDRGYDVIVSGVDGPSRMITYTQNPFDNRPPVVVNYSGLESTAAGRYQVLHRYWVYYKAMLGLSDFGPLSQDLVAIQQMRECNALEPIADGDLITTIALTTHLWASLPGNRYGQAGGKTFAQCWDKFIELQEMG